MIQYINGYSVANSIRMKRGQHKGSFLIVEGDTDSRIYKKFTDQTQCFVEIAHGRENVLHSLKILEEANFQGVLAVIDADFDVLLGIKHLSSNLLLTDSHDLETMILKTSAFEDTLVEYIPPSEPTHIIGNRIRQVLLDVGLIVGCLRLVAAQEKLSLSFKNVNYTKLIDRNTVTLDVITLITMSKNSTIKCRLTDQEIQELLEQKRKEDFDRWHIYHGHSMVEALATILDVILNQEYGSKISDKIKAKLNSGEIERSLRLAYNLTYFMNTQLYAAIKAWESRNTPFKVLLGN